MGKRTHSHADQANAKTDDLALESAETITDVLNGPAQTQLRSVIERVERLLIEKREIMEQVKEVYADAKGNGFDVKILRKVVKLRSMDRAKRQEEDAVLDLYMSALGELDDL